MSTQAAAAVSRAGEKQTLIHIIAQEEGAEDNHIALCGRKVSVMWTPAPGERAECEICELLAQAIELE